MIQSIKCWAIGALLALGTGCSKTPELDVSTAPQKEIIATHAFNTSSPITALSFTPNDVAPWLGRIIYINQDGELYSTDIEGRAPKRVGSGTYSHVNGMLQIKKPGVFFALAKNTGALEAFIESDNEGQFSPLILSGPPILVRGICQTMTAQSENLLVLTKGGSLVNLNAQISTENVELTQVSSTEAPKNTTNCAYDEQNVYALANQKDTSTLHAYKDSKWHMTALDFTPSGFASLTLKERPALAVLGTEGVLFIDAEDLSTLYHIKITDGLSIRGLESAGFVSVTSAPFGGAAFNEGVIVLSDKSKPRLVFISLGYLNDRLSAVQ